MAEIQREILDKLKAWKENPRRKPLVLQGARQVGKSWALKKFGRECFEDMVYINFDTMPAVKEDFKRTKEPLKLIKSMELMTGKKIIPTSTLIVLDEIQECNEALNSLKYFCEDAPEYHIIAAGSLLGVAVKKRKMTVPVGKVRVIRMHPLSFKEFLRASDYPTFEYIEQISTIEKLPEIILNKLKLEYRRYMVCGGMPDAVCAMLENRGMDAVDSILQDILDLYELDFAKYAEPREIPRIHAIWH